MLGINESKRFPTSLSQISKEESNSEFQRDLLLSDIDEKNVDWGRMQKIRHNLNKNKSFAELFNIGLNLKLKSNEISQINKWVDETDYDEDLAGYVDLAAEKLLDYIYTADEEFDDESIDYLVEAIYEYKEGNTKEVQLILDNLQERVLEFDKKYAD